MLLYKRLERGTFHRPTQPAIGQRHVELDAGELGLLLEGVDLRGAARRAALAPAAPRAGGGRRLRPGLTGRRPRALPRPGGGRVTGRPRDPRTFCS
jgi:hypothetical protein